MAIKEHLTGQNLYTGYFTDADLSISESMGHHMRILQHDQKGIFDVIREIVKPGKRKSVSELFINEKNILQRLFL